jgi:hypothetical protein
VSRCSSDGNKFSLPSFDLPYLFINSPISCDYYVIFVDVKYTFNVTLKQSYQKSIRIDKYKDIMVHYSLMVKTALPGPKLDAKFIVSDTEFQFILFQ